MLGTIDAEELGALLAHIIEQDGAAMFDRINSMAELSPDYDGMLSGLLSILHDTAVAQVLPDAPTLLTSPGREFARRLDRGGSPALLPDRPERAQGTCIWRRTRKPRLK